MLALLGALPIIGTAVTAFFNAMFNAKVEITRAKIGGDRDVAVELVKAAAAQEHENTAKLSIFSGNLLLTVLLISFATPLVIFEWKVIVIDIVFQAGSTDPIRGQVADWANTIIAFLFGSATAVALGKMWFARREQ